MPQCLIDKLEHFTRLSCEEREALRQLARRRQCLNSREDILREGDTPSHVGLILSGWACRYKQLEDGRRQIISFFLPGDLCDTHVSVLQEMDHAIGTLTPVTYAELARSEVSAVTDRYPRVTQALWWDTQVAAAIQREWTVNLGQRAADERLGHLLCELFTRLRGVGLTDGNSCLLPLTQADMAEATGLSNVHINRTLQELRGSGLIVLKDRRLVIPDLTALMRASLFDPGYLHLNRIGRHLDSNEA